MKEDNLKLLARSIMFRYVAGFAYVFSLVGLMFEQIWLFGLLFVVALLMAVSSATFEIMFFSKTLFPKKEE